MNDQEIATKAQAVIDRALRSEGVTFFVQFADQDRGVYEDVERAIADVKFSVLREGAPVVVFFWPDGRVRGWRDDGRTGGPVSAPIDEAQVAAAIAAELEIEDVRVLGAEPALLADVGWTTEALIGLPRSVRFSVWLHPRTLKIIQVLEQSE